MKNKNKHPLIKSTHPHLDNKHLLIYEKVTHLNKNKMTIVFIKYNIYSLTLTLVLIKYNNYSVNLYTALITLYHGIPLTRVILSKRLELTNTIIGNLNVTLDKSYSSNVTTKDINLIYPQLNVLYNTQIISKLHVNTLVSQNAYVKTILNRTILSPSYSIFYKTTHNLITTLIQHLTTSSPINLR